MLIKAFPKVNLICVLSPSHKICWLEGMADMSEAKGPVIHFN